MMLGKASEKRICVFCKLPRRVYLKNDVSLAQMIILLFVTGVLAYAIWQGPDLRSMLIFMSLAFTLQIFMRVRYRASLKCPHCGFDPILYAQEPEKAAQRVKGHMDARKDNPAFMLKPQPQIKPLVKKSKDWRQALNPPLPEADPKEELPPVQPTTTASLVDHQM